MVESEQMMLLGKWIGNARRIAPAPAPAPAPLSIRQQAGVALLQVCRDHCMSIFILLKAGDGQTVASALALLRPALEACLRGGWIDKCLEDDEFSPYQDKKPIPSKIKCLKALEGRIHPQTFAALSVHLEKVKGSYDDFSHGGHQQILRRFDGTGSIGKRGTKEEELYLTHKALLYDLVAAQWMAEAMGDTRMKEELFLLMGSLSPLSIFKAD